MERILGVIARLCFALVVVGVGIVGSSVAASADPFDPDPPVAGETTSISIGPIEQTVSYGCIAFNIDGTCATYRICPSPSSVSYTIRFTSPSGEVYNVTLDSTFTPADPYPSAPNGGPSGEFMLTGEFTFPEAGDWTYQSTIVRNNICGSSQAATSVTEVAVAEDATIPVIDPLVGGIVATMAAPFLAVASMRRRSNVLG